MSETDEPPLEDDGPAIPDPDHGIPGDAEPLPEGDAETETAAHDDGGDPVEADNDPVEDDGSDDAVIEGDPEPDDSE